MTVDRLFWHDGILVDISFAIDERGSAFAIVSALLYGDAQAPKRELCRIRCEDVSRYHCTLDVGALKANRVAGHISDGNRRDSTLRVYFTDGVLEIDAKKFRLIRE